MRVQYFILLLIISNPAMGQVYKPLVSDSKKDFRFKNEGKVIEWLDGPEKIDSDMVVNGDALTDIQFATAKLNGDTLNVEIYQTDESHDHHYRIEIIKNTYKIDYNFSYPVDTVTRKIEPLDFRLIVNTKVFKKGTVLRGYTEFKGKCTVNCYDDIIEAKGFFMVTIE
jgi:hypothetical protein